MPVLGISCDYHDAAAAVVVDGEVVAAAEEERFTRVKHDASLPVHAIASCLAIAGIEPDDLEAVVFHEKPLAVVNRVLAARQRRGPRAVRSFARELPVLLRRNVMVAYRTEQALRAMGATRSPEFRYSEHHLSHAAAAFYPSPFERAAVLTIDGIGEWATATIGHGVGPRVDLLAEQRYPSSLGLVYSLMTVRCGFEANDGEYKLMGLAPYGEPRFTDALAELVTQHDDGSITVDAKAVRWWSSDTRSSRRLDDLFDGPALAPGAPLTQREADLARSVQVLTESVVLAMARHAHELTGETDLCLAGGVALNCVANGRVLREGPFERVWVQPAAGDAGSAVGAALWYAHEEGRASRERRPDPDRPGGMATDGMRGSYLGPAFDADDVAAWLSGAGVAFTRVADLDERCEQVATVLADGRFVGWFEGRMEFGPRALGHRSILADPRPATAQRDLNLRVKGRESFRPFAPAVPVERASEWFDLKAPSPYMLFTFDVTAAHRMGPPVSQIEGSLLDHADDVRSTIPACTHIDWSARVQTVDPVQSPVFHRLLEMFGRQTGCPVLLNTSFNVAGEPIVCTPEHALATARRAGLDLLVIEDCLVELVREDAGSAATADPVAVS